MTNNNQILNNNNMQPVSSDQLDDEINLVDFLYPIYKRREFLTYLCVGIAFVGGIVSLFLPKTYEATTIIFPVTSESNTGLRSQLTSDFLQQFGLSAVSGGSASTSTAIFQSILKSNGVALDVLNRYDYFSIMGINKNGEKISAEAFAEQLGVTPSRTDNTISIKVQSYDPILAADIANTYVKALDKYNLTNTFTSTRYLREYIEKRLDAADKELDTAQQELRDFQEKNRAVSISQQAEATLKVLGEMEAQRVSIEVQKAAKEKFYKGPHIEIEQLTAQMEALQKNIDSLTYSEDASVPIEMEQGKVEFYIPLNRIPALNFDESKLLLKVRAKTGVVTMLTSQLEQARLDEAKDMPTINTLELAYPPENPVKPRIILNMALSFIVSLFLGIFIIFFIEFIQKMDQDPETAPKWLEMKKGIVGIMQYLERPRQYLLRLLQSPIVKEFSQKVLFSLRRFRHREE